MTTSPKQLYKDVAMRYQSDLVPVLYSESEYSALIGKHTKACLTDEAKGEVDVAHVIAAELGFGAYVIDGTGEEVIGYHVGNDTGSGKHVIIVHCEHAYVPQVPVPSVALEGLPS